MEKFFKKTSREQFLKNYWKKKPLFVKGVFKEDELPQLDPNEISGFSLEEEVESRLMQYDGDPRQMQISFGPFDQSTLEHLPSENWTLLVQRLDALHFETMQFRNRFDIAPQWLLDDVMVSVAGPGGGVGAHLDEYDVFLVQGVGKRKWHVGRHALFGKEAAYVEDLEFRLLQSFDDYDEYIAEPGDVLYIPPRFAHDGIALDLCSTYSIGYRAPDVREVIRYACDNSMQETLMHNFSFDEHASSLPLTEEAVVQWRENVMTQISEAIDANLVAKFLTHTGSVVAAASSQNLDDLDKEALLRLELFEKDLVVETTQGFDYYVSGEKHGEGCSDVLLEFSREKQIRVAKILNDPHDRALFQKLLDCDLVYVEEGHHAQK